MIDRLRDLLGIGRATLIDDAGDIQRVQVTEGAAGHGVGDRITDGVRRIMEFGFTSVPPIGSELLLARRSGERSQTMAIGSNHRASRPRSLQPGDTCLYDVRGRRVILDGEGVEVDAKNARVVIRNATSVRIIASERVVLDAPTVEVMHDLLVHGTTATSGNISTTGSIAAEGEIAVGAIKLTAHKHDGVKSGSDVSGSAKP